MALILMLGGESKAAAAMYGSLKSPQAKAETFLSVARTVLPPDLARVFEAVVIQIRSTEIRNRLAHGLWAHSEDVPDALLFVDAKHEFTRERLRADVVWRSDLGDQRIPKIHPKHVFVYREPDLTEAIDAVAQCYQYPNDLCSLAGLNSVGRNYTEAQRIKNGMADAYDRIYTRLSSEPQIRKILDRSKKAPPDSA